MEHEHTKRIAFACLTLRKSSEARKFHRHAIRAAREVSGARTSLKWASRLFTMARIAMNVGSSPNKSCRGDVTNPAPSWSLGLRLAPATENAKRRPLDENGARQSKRTRCTLWWWPCRRRKAKHECSGHKRQPARSRTAMKRRRFEQVVSCGQRGGQVGDEAEDDLAGQGANVPERKL